MHNSVLAVLFAITGLISFLIGFKRPHQFEEDFYDARYWHLADLLHIWYKEDWEKGQFRRTSVAFTTIFLIMAFFMFTLEPLVLVLAIGEKIGKQYLIAPILICVAFQWVFVLGRLYANRSPNVRIMPPSRFKVLGEMVAFITPGLWMSLYLAPLVF